MGQVLEGGNPVLRPLDQANIKDICGVPGSSESPP